MIKLKKVKIYNYKSLKEVNLEINDCLIIIGKNNSGKTNILEAINLGFTYNSIFKEDIYVSKLEPFNYEKKVIIEFMFCPINENGEEVPMFDDYWTIALGDRISFLAENGNQFFAFMTELSYNSNKDLFINKKYVINNWIDNDFSPKGKPINRDDLESFFTMYINAQRDLALDISDKTSQWFKLTSNIKMPSDDEAIIEQKIEDVNKKIIDNNSIFQKISSNLKKTTPDIESNINIVPITKDLSHLYRGMNVYYENDSIEPTAVERLGLGIRSWGTFSIIKSYIENEAEKSNENGYAFHSILLIEEPESHLHPQAQRHFISNINEIKFQKIITTHSPYILSQIELSNILYVKKIEATTMVSRLTIDDLNKEELININNKVMNTRGEIFYSNFVILVEGETEEFTIPIYFNRYFHKEPFELGVTIIGVDGSGKYKPFVSLLEKLNINWCIFSDGEDNTLNDVKKVFRDLNLGSIENNEHLYYIPNKKCLEIYLVDCKYKKYIKKAIDIIEDKKDFLNYYKTLMQGMGRSKKYSNLIFGDNIHLQRDYTQQDSDNIALKDILLDNKIKYSKEIAIQIAHKRKKIPKRIKKMLNYVKTKL